MNLRCTLAGWGLIVFMLFFIQSQMLGLVLCIRDDGDKSIEPIDLDGRCQCAITHPKPQIQIPAWHADTGGPACQDIAIFASFPHEKKVLLHPHPDWLLGKAPLPEKKPLPVAYRGTDKGIIPLLDEGSFFLPRRC